MMPVIEGRCPECWKVMQNWSKSLICNFKRYNFPFKIWYCDKHGVYMWAGREHKLVDLRQATHIEPLEQQVKDRFAESESRMPTPSDYAIISLKCPHCKSEWAQTKITCTPIMTCPFCHREISEEEAKTT